MNEFWRKTWLFTVADFASLLLFFVGSFGAFLFAVFIIAQLGFGVILCFSPERKLIGQSLLAALGLFLLIGFSVCTLVLVGMSGTNFH